MMPIGKSFPAIAGQGFVISYIHIHFSCTSSCSMQKNASRARWRNFIVEDDRRLFKTGSTTRTYIPLNNQKFNVVSAHFFK